VTNQRSFDDRVVDTVRGSFLEEGSLPAISIRAGHHIRIRDFSTIAPQSSTTTGILNDSRKKRSR